MVWKYVTTKSYLMRSYGIAMFCECTPELDVKSSASMLTSNRSSRLFVSLPP